MAESSIQRVGIVGGGLMGTGIAEAAARSGFATALVKASGGDGEETRARIASSLNKSVERGKLSSEEAAGAMSRLTVSGDRSVLASADIIIESIVEDLGKKQALFAELMPRVSESAIFASNTSTLRIRDLAAEGAEDRTIGLHFFSPVPAMRLVELAHIKETDEEVIERATAFVTSLGKSAIPVADSSGFIVNRLLLPYLLGAISAYSQGLAPADNIDAAMSMGCGHPVGPLMLCDLIGLDIVYAMSQLLHRDFGDDCYRPPALLRQVVQSGQLGKKSGTGFYDHSQRPATPNRQLWKRITDGTLVAANTSYSGESI